MHNSYSAPETKNVLKFWWMQEIGPVSVGLQPALALYRLQLDIDLEITGYENCSFIFQIQACT